MFKQSGLTLIELMVVVAIIGIIAAIALPSYQSYIEKSRRADATTILMKVAAEQEKYYMQNNRYGTTAQIAAKMNVGTSTTNIETQNDFYNVAVASTNTARDFTVTATAKGVQLSDTACKFFTYTQSGVRGAKTSTTAVNTDECW